MFVVKFYNAEKVIYESKPYENDTIENVINEISTFIKESFETLTSITFTDKDNNKVIISKTILQSSIIKIEKI